MIARSQNVNRINVGKFTIKMSLFNNPVSFVPFLSPRASSVSEDFVSSSRLSELAAKRTVTQLKQWQSNSRLTVDDPRVVLHYAYEKDPSSVRLLRSHAPDNRQLKGAIIGCRWTEGRWTGKDALEFKHPGDRVRLHIAGEYDSLTYSAWVRIDGLDRPFSAMMLTNGYDVGEAHWQLRNDGRLLLGVQTPKGHVAYPMRRKHRAKKQSLTQRPARGIRFTGSPEIGEAENSTVRSDAEQIASPYMVRREFRWTTCCLSNNTEGWSAGREI